MPQEPLILQKKLEVFLNKEVYPILQNFPRAEKFALCQEIKQALYWAIRNTMLANSTRRGDLRESRFREVDADLKLLLVLFGSANQQRYITEKTIMRMQDRLSELGRITGGLIKAAQGNVKGQTSLYNTPG